MTETGLSLGTPHYMSPEQATAEKKVTHRSDIYSLGCVLYETLTGDPPHTGSSAQAIIMKIVTDEARPVTELRKSVPPNVASAVAMALEKLPADRFKNAADFAQALQIGISRPVPSSQDAIPGGRPLLGGVGWVVAVVGLAFGAWGILSGRGSERIRPDTKHLNIVLPDSAPLAFIGSGSLGAGRRALTLTPDGQTLVYAARVGEKEQLYKRDMKGFMASPIGGTDGAFDPFVSPGGEWVGYFAGTEIRRVPLGGGESNRLASVPGPAGATWSKDGRILVALREGTELGWVPESGGTIEVIANPQALGRTRPHLLPDGRHALVEIWAPPMLSGVIGVTDLETGRTLALTSGGPVVADSVNRSDAFHGRQPSYLLSGHIVYSVPAGLVAMPFDPAENTIAGRPVDVLSGARRDVMGVHYAVGADGTLVYASGGDGNVGALAWADRNGAIDSLGFPAQWYGTFELSPDGERVVAVVFPDAGTWEIWVYDLSRGTTSKLLTSDLPSMPRWWPDGRQIVFTETSPEIPYGRTSIRQLAESSGQRDTIVDDWEITDISADSSRAVGTIGAVGPDRRGVWILPLGGDQQPILLDSYAGAWGPSFSPDGRWIAYTSNESGRYEVYVAAAEEPGAREQVSLDGGEEPVWSPQGNELIYRWGQEWFAVPVPPPDEGTFGRPRMIFAGSFVNVGWRSHDISLDGRRHLVVLGPLEQSIDHLNVITDWVGEVARRVTH